MLHGEQDAGGSALSWSLYSSKKWGHKKGRSEEMPSRGSVTVDVAEDRLNFPMSYQGILLF